MHISSIKPSSVILSQTSIVKDWIWCLNNIAENIDNEPLCTCGEIETTAHKNLMPSSVWP